MPQVVTQSDVDGIAEGTTLRIDADAMVTPMATERAAARRIQIERGGRGGQETDGTRDAVRAVTRAVVGRLGDAGPQVIEAVVAEVLAALGGASLSSTATTPRGAVMLPLLAPPTVDYCSACVDQERRRERQRAVMTTTGKNTKGIVARITAQIADLGGDILDISQTLVGDYFTMIIVVDVASLAVPFERFQETLIATVGQIGCQTMMMHEDVMATLHRV
ncbi:MAG: hypothetical protein EXR72_19960 [Myxococcales bacterium]|nr:hypothetical protein [Myxococcales bacterium]